MRMSVSTQEEKVEETALVGNETTRRRHTTHSMLRFIFLCVIPKASTNPLSACG